MEEFKEIDGELYIKYDDMYYIGSHGEVYSMYSNTLLKHSIDHDGYHRVDIHGKHMKVSRLVFLTWNGPIPEGKVIRHLDDDKDNDCCLNLVLGSQKDNMNDAIRNQHKNKSGNTYHLIVKDSATGEILTFCPAKDFIDYSGHGCANGNIPRMFKKKWFKERYTIIEYKLGKV
jgi:hypothetical protein